MGRGALKAAVLWAGLALSGGALAGDVSGTLVLESPGTPVPVDSIVVYLTGFTEPPPPESQRIAQKNKVFMPGLRVITAGQTVSFTNDDLVLHNVFSTSDARPFDLGKPGPGQSREVKFPRPGLVEVYCNIHETMSASVLVLPNRAFSFVDASGHYVIHDVPPGKHVLHAYGRDVDPTSAELTVTSAAPVTAATLTAHHRAFKAGHLDKYGRPYRAHAGYAP